MAGQYGNVRITTQNLKVVKLLEDKDIILIEGSVPGSKNGVVLLRDAIKYKIHKMPLFQQVCIVKIKKIKIFIFKSWWWQEYTWYRGAKVEN